MNEETLNEIYSNSSDNVTKNEVVEQNENNNQQTQETEQTQEVVQAQQTEQVETQKEVQTQQPEQPTIPETYEFVSPNGELSEFDKTAYSNVAKEMGLTQEQAQKFFEVSEKQLADTLQQKVADQSQRWYQEVLNDTEIGGAKFEQTKVNLNRVMSKFGTPEVRELFNQSGLGNHPALLKFINNIGASLVEEQQFIKGDVPKKELTEEEILNAIYNRS